jgi:hypothetical protein
MATRAEWGERLKRWAKSGTSIEAFAAREGLDPRQLKWWRWKLRPASPPAPEAPAPTFVPVHVVDGSSRRAEASVALEIVLPNGWVLRVPAGVEDAELERVLAIAARGPGC